MYIEPSKQHDMKPKAKIRLSKEPGERFISREGMCKSIDLARLISG